MSENGNGDGNPVDEELRFLDIATLSPRPTKRIRVNGKEFQMYALLDLPMSEYVDIESDQFKNLSAEDALARGIQILTRCCVDSTPEDFKGLTMRQYYELMTFAARDIDKRNNRIPQSATAPTASN